MIIYLNNDNRFGDHFYYRNVGTCICITHDQVIPKMRT